MNQEKKEILKEIKEFVKNESLNANKRLNKENQDDIYTYHIKAVVDYSDKLAKYYDANRFVVIVASYLHDIYYIQTRDHKDHEIRGCEFAQDYLKGFDINKDEKELIKKCILSHRGSKKVNKETIEEKIVACSDAMDHISRARDMYYRVSSSEKTNKKQAIEFMRKKLKRGWDKIELDYAKEIILEDYYIARKFFE